MEDISKDRFEEILLPLKEKHLNFTLKELVEALSDENSEFHQNLLRCLGRYDKIGAELTNVQFQECLEAAWELAQYSKLKVVVEECGETITIGRLTVCMYLSKGRGIRLFEGIFQERKVEVKLMSNFDRADIEIKNLNIFSKHRSIIDYYGFEKLTFSNNNAEVRFRGVYILLEKGERLIHKITSDHLVVPNPDVWKHFKEILFGLNYLHNSGYAHGNLSPTSVIYVKVAGREHAKLANLERCQIIGRRLGNKQDHPPWPSPEMLNEKAPRATEASDIFALGCLLYYILTGGEDHPFIHEDDINDVKTQNLKVRKNMPLNISKVDHLPEVKDALIKMLCFDEANRPKTQDLLEHPFLWESEERHNFLSKVSDQLEVERTKNQTTILDAVKTVKVGDDWTGLIEVNYFKEMNDERKRIQEALYLNSTGYDGKSTPELLRLIRNTGHHMLIFRRFVQREVDEYFCSIFPSLFMDVYFAVEKACPERAWFKKFKEKQTRE